MRQYWFFAIVTWATCFESQGGTLLDYQTAVNNNNPSQDYHFAGTLTNSVAATGGSLSTAGTIGYNTDFFGNATQVVGFGSAAGSSVFRGNLDLGPTGSLVFLFQTPSATVASDQYLLHDDTSTAGSFLRLVLNGSSLKLTAANLAVQTVSSSMITNQWYFYAMTWDVAAGQLNYYLGTAGNSSSLASTGLTISTSSSVGNTAATFFVGNFSNSSTASFSGGNIDEFASFDTALSSTAIGNIFTTTVPEPSTCAMVVLGGVAAFYRKLLPRRAR